MRWVIVLLLCALPSSFAQQYFATNGFSKPEQVITSEHGTLRETAGVYIDEAGTVLSLYAMPTGVHLHPVFPPGTATLIGDHNNVRDLFTGQGSELSAVWIGRNRSNGRSHYHWQTREGHSDLFNLGEQLKFTPAPTAAGEFFLVRPLVGGSELRIIRPDTENPEGLTVFTSAQVIDAISATPAANGSLDVLWLEGDTSRTAFGSISDWTAYTQQFDPTTWEPLTSREALGSGSVAHSRDRSAIQRTHSGLVALWPSEHGTLLQSVQGASGWAVTDTGITGRIIGATPAGVYWYEGTSIYFSSLPLPEDYQAAPLISSPVTIEGANIAARTVHGEEHTAITWFGRTLRGLPEVYVSHTFEPYEPTWWDGIIATLGWNPWNYGEQFFGQLLTALVVAAVGGLILLTLVWVLKAVLLDRVFPRVPAQRMGEYAAAAVFLATMVLFSSASGGITQVVNDLLVLGPITLIAVLLARLWRPSYRQEPVLVAILSSFLVLVITITIWVFITYPRWATLVGLT